MHNNNQANTKAIIFDLDGTLIDSLIDIALCANKVLEEFNLPSHKIDAYRNFLGGGALFLIKNCMPRNSSDEMIEKVLERFKVVYDEQQHFNTKPYEGIYELLKELKNRNIKVGVLSNKPHYFTCKYIDEFFKDLNLDEVHGQKDEVPRKPDPKGAIDIANSFGIACENIFFVGDSDVDMNTAKNANMIAVGVEWGFRGPFELIENGAKHIVKTPNEILDLF